MTRFFALLFVATLAAPLAYARSYTFTPNPGERASCQALGFAGAFSFQTDAKYPNIGRVAFSSSRGFAVLRAGSPQQWRMSIQGSWSESISLDFAAGTLSYHSGRPGRAGHCRGRFR